MPPVLGVRAETPLDDGLRQTIEWFQPTAASRRPHGVIAALKTRGSGASIRAAR